MKARLEWVTEDLEKDKPFKEFCYKEEKNTFLQHWTDKVDSREKFF